MKLEIRSIRKLETSEIWESKHHTLKQKVKEEIVVKLKNTLRQTKMQTQHTYTYEMQQKTVLRGKFVAITFTFKKKKKRKKSTI
jgi:hypothetical protein